MRPIGVEPKAISTISNNDLEKTPVLSETKSAESGANGIFLVNLITKLVSLSESELAKLSEALINSKGNS